jgi:hypothetical protein
MNHRIGFCCNLLSIFVAKMAPAVGFEPTTNRLTADRSTTELRWILFAARSSGVNFAHPISCGKCDFRPRTQIGNRFFEFDSAHHIGIIRTRGGAAW